ncbi:hypothetical protein Dda_2991 [Drechslerella dactyloides]|uniref:Uncharacterized protein n=1 Tax=Drechslerella dactyloides TaxID=74499 RepID=A0AAD6J4X3_DREDA|nr:hypothetical protein Dda_2991 [Drechslerella dactyloides]
MSRDAQAGDTYDGGIHRYRQDGTTFASVSIRALDNPEPSIQSLRGIPGPPISSIRRLSFAVNDGEEQENDDDDDDDQYERRRQLVSEIAREATGLADEDVHIHGHDHDHHIQSYTTKTTSTTQGRDNLVGGSRRWPTKAVTDENIDGCYVDFILCCNPAVPDNCDTEELCKSFRAPPKSDGVMFSVFKLFQLIKRFEEGDIKTWIQLVTELGVERKQDQSTQKVQQYAVRLKRWMHAMHVDAFFEYCLNRSHVYYTDIPSALPGLDNELRDGVPLEEDLALRALIPEYRPKRGRRKLERSSIDSGHLIDGNAEKRPKQSLLPATLPNILSPDGSNLLHYDDGHTSLARGDGSPRLWPEIRVSDPPPLFPSVYTNPFDSLHSLLPGGQQFRWRSAQNSSDPIGKHSEGEGSASAKIHLGPAPQFLSVKRARRSHGPAVSSAWPSSGSSRGGRSRGRPTMHRGASETGYSTFTASPRSLEVQLDDHDIAVSLGQDLVLPPVAIEDQPPFPSEVHQTILPPIIHPLEDPAYDNDVEIAPLLERDDLRDAFHHFPINPYHGVQKAEDIKAEFATRLNLLGTSGDHVISLNLASALAFSTVERAIEAGCGRADGDTTLRSLSTLLGLDGLVMHDLVIKKCPGLSDEGPTPDVHQLQKEMTLFERYRGDDSEEQSIHDLINAAETISSPHTLEAPIEHEVDQAGKTTVDEKYELSWKIKLGPIEASVSATVTPAWDPDHTHTSQEELRLRDEVDMLLSDMETGNPSPSSFPGSASDLLLNDDLDFPPEGPVDWRAKYFETREKLRKAEEDLEKLKSDLIARVMS